MDHYTEACELIGDVLDDSAEVGLNDEGKVRVAQALATLALADALRNPVVPVPPGPCFEPNWNLAGGTLRCVLGAGHAGAHTWRTAAGGEGHWITATEEAER